MDGIHIGRPFHGRSTTSNNGSRNKKKTLSELNSMLESGLYDDLQANEDEMWLEWLWESDALKECYMETMMNRMHLLGLLIARYRAATLEAEDGTLLEFFFPGSIFHIFFMMCDTA